MKLGELDRPARSRTRRSKRCAGRTVSSQLHARCLSRARPLRRQGSDDLRRHRAAARRGRSRAAAQRTARRPSTSRSSAPRRTRSPRCCDRVRHGTLPDVGRRGCDGATGGDAGRQPRGAGRIAGRSSARACARTRPATSKTLVLAARRARLVREVALELTDSCVRSRRSASLLGGRRRRSTWSSAIRSIASHPVRLIGRTLDVVENAAAAAGADGYGGGILLFVGAGGGLVARRRSACSSPRLDGVAGRRAGSSTPSFSTACSRSAICCATCGGSSAPCAAATSSGARRRVARSSAATPTRWTAAACRRAAIESLSENLTDGFIEPAVLVRPRRASGPRAVQGRQHDGLDGRLQDAAISALRLVRRAARRRDELRAGGPTWLLIAALAALLPGLLRPRRPGASAAPARSPARPELGLERGGDRRRDPAAARRPDLAEGRLVTDVWIGDPADPPLETAADVGRAVLLAVASGLAAALAALALGAALAGAAARACARIRPRRCAPR